MSLGEPIEDDDPDAEEPMIPAFPWQGPLDERSLSTRRGFAFQYPPFPTLSKAMGESTLRRDEPLGLYVHVPFCSYRCAFCYYAITLNSSARGVEAYLDAVDEECRIVAARPTVAGVPARTLFWGGGTPTFLTVPQLERLMAILREHFGLDQLVEATFECDPTTITRQKARALHALGFNRVSLGVQSFSSAINQLNERKHSQEEALAAIATLRDAGFSNLNLDLICGLVGETDESWAFTVSRLLELAPEHVTIYFLSVRPQTLVHKRAVGLPLARPPGERARIRMYRHARNALLAEGYRQTTPNCFVREPRYEQLHQRNAWSSLPLLGIGNSAYSYIDGCVTQNVRPLQEYRERLARGESPLAVGQRLSVREQMIRYVVLRLKQLSVSRAAFWQRFGVELADAFPRPIRELEALELVRRDEDALVLTESGIIYVDDVCRTFYSDEVRECLANEDGATIGNSPLQRSLV